MRDHIVPFLKVKGDPNISSEEHDRELLVPAFCYRRTANCFNINFSRNIRLTELFGSVISDLPEEVFFQLLSTRNLFFSFSADLAFVQQMSLAEFPRDAVLCFFSSRLLDLSDSAVRGTISHELGHIHLQHFTAAVQGMQRVGALEDEADDLARSWGFGFEIDTVRGRLKADSQI